MNPAVTLSKLLVGTGDVQQLANYYTTCNGTNPFSGDYYSALNYFDTLNSTFYDYYGDVENYLAEYYSSASTACLNNLKSQVR